jgi:hypothetical protein
MGNRDRIIVSQTHTRLPKGWIFCPISIPMETIFVSYPYPNRGIPHGLAGIGSPLTSLGAIVLDRICNGAGTCHAEFGYWTFSAKIAQSFETFFHASIIKIWVHIKFQFLTILTYYYYLKNAWKCKNKITYHKYYIYFKKYMYIMYICILTSKYNYFRIFLTLYVRYLRYKLATLCDYLNYLHQPVYVIYNTLHQLHLLLLCPNGQCGQFICLQINIYVGGVLVSWPWATSAQVQPAKGKIVVDNLANRRLDWVCRKLKFFRN